MTTESLSLWIALLAGLAILPFVLTMITSFAKLVIVFGLIRQALGLQQIPPNTVITGLSLILTVHVMYPTIGRTVQNYQRFEADAAKAVAQPAPEGEDEDARNVRLASEKADEAWRKVGNALRAAEGPMTSFLTNNSTEHNNALFERLREELREGPDADQTVDAEGQEPEKTVEDVIADAFPGHGETARSAIDTLTVRAPAFVLTELTEAFQIGFLIFVPFLIIDLVVSNILLAMGMHMMSPVTISLPLKLLLFVLIGGWEIILTGLVLGYTP